MISGNVDYLPELHRSLFSQRRGESGITYSKYYDYYCMTAVKGTF